jgi:hypothetical protein
MMNVIMPSVVLPIVVAPENDHKKFCAGPTQVQEARGFEQGIILKGGRLGTFDLLIKLICFIKR